MILKISPDVSNGNSNLESKTAQALNINVGS